MSLCAKIFAKHGNSLQVTGEGYETGHEPVHTSSSGTCVKINTAKDVWHCSNPTCGAGGGSITALMSLEGLAYDEAEAAVQAMGGVAKPRPPRIASFILNEKNRPRTIIANVLKVLHHNPRWKAALRYNVFSDEVEVCQAPPPYDPMPWSVQALTEELAIEITAWMQETYELYVPASLVWDGLRTFAAQFPYHPVRTYLESLVWDGTPRLRRWLSTYCFVEDTPYSQAVGRLTLVGAAARVMEPGCKMDTVLILEGPQGWNKSTVWRTLASDEWFTDALPDLHTKDAAQALRGKWLIEFADLDNFRRAELETIKRFLSATQDHYRPSYGRRAVTFPRHNIFMGTTNKWTYLLDETGNRRFYPTRVTKPCDIEALARDRDQLWAEALHAYTTHGKWYLDDPDLLRQATAEQDARMEEDAWTELIHTYLEKRKAQTAAYKGETVEYVTTGEILALALQIDRTHWNAGTSRRVAAVLRLDKWTHGQIDPPGTQGTRKRPKVFMRPYPGTAPQPSSGTDGTDELHGGTDTLKPVPPPQPSSGTDGTDELHGGTDTLKPVPPPQTSLGTDGTDGTDSLEIQRDAERTPSRTCEDDARLNISSRALQGSCSVFPEFIETALASVPSVPESLIPESSVGCEGTDANHVSVPSVPNAGVGTDTAGVGPDTGVSVRPTIDPGHLEYMRTPTRAEEVLRTFQDAPLIGIDFETTPLDAPITHIRLVQLAVPGRTVVLDMHQIPAGFLRPLLQSRSRFVGHNLKFELHHLAAAGLPWPEHLTDTMHLAQMLGASAEQRPKGYYGLDGVVERELDLSLDKTLQKSDWSGELSHEQVLYAARDAAAELPLYHRLTEACTKAGLDRIRAIEEACLPALTWTEMAGVLIDEQAWQERSEHDVLELGIIEADLCALLHQAAKQGIELPKVPEAVLWTSPKQVLGVLQALGAADITSTAEVILAALAPDYPLVARLLDHRHFSQRIKNGGATWLRNHIHPITHRVHADYQQVGTRAGRMSCWTPNMQQIPRSADYRTSIIAAPGRVILKADYSQIELRIGALEAPEPRMLEALRAGEDLHDRTAASMLGCAIADVDKSQRNIAKAINFGFLYGMGVPRFRAETLKKYKIVLTEEQAIEHREMFFRLYPGLRAWHKATGALLRYEGAIETRTPLGRRRLGVARYSEALNTPVQGAAADGFKLATARLYANRHEAPDTRLIMSLHDELVAECPVEQAQEAAAWLARHMQAAMDEVVQGQIPIGVEVQIGKDWAGTPYTG